MAGHGSFRVLCQKEALLDARITKQRLSNLISYDWIKIVVTIVVACLVLALLFAFTAARPRRAQEFYVYAYTDVSTGSDFSSLKEELEDGVFSYDILSVGTEGFDGSMGSTTYTLRRSVGSGNVLFVTDNRVYETDEEGQIVLDEEGEPVVETESTLYTMASGSVVSKDSSTAGVVYDTKYYLDACERYLAQFFGDDWRTNDAFDGERTPAGSFSRNAKDKRYRTDEQKARYLERLFEETYLKDVVDRYEIRKRDELDDLVNVLASGVGALTNPSKLENTFRSVLRSKISSNTISSYIGYLVDAFVIEAARRYDVKGRGYIGSPLKYYFEDVGLRNARLGFRQVEESHIMENVVYNELRARGYSVDVGVVEKRAREAGKDVRKQLEVDFVANRGSDRVYVQSAMEMRTPEKAAQEKASLLGINDSFKKVVLVRDVVRPLRDERGVVTMSVFDFLLDESALTGI